VVLPDIRLDVAVSILLRLGGVEPLQELVLLMQFSSPLARSKRLLWSVGETVVVVERVPKEGTIKFETPLLKAVMFEPDPDNERPDTLNPFSTAS
jgi:hypothetical protein